jgi:N-acetylneuraminic acid mutarotase
LNGKVLAIGGRSNSEVFSEVEEFDPQENLWTVRGSLPDIRSGGTVAVVDGVLYYIGGVSSVNAFPPLTDVWAYSPISGSWTSRAPMPAARELAASGVIDGEVYVVGGLNLGQTFSTLYIYNPSTDTWRKGPAMPAARWAHGAAVVGGVLYVVGGMDPVSGLVAETVFAYRPK